MSTVQLHLLLNHLPILGSAFGVVILAYGLLRKQAPVIEVGLGLCLLVGLGTMGAFLTGEGAEEAVEHLSGVSHAVIHAHEEAAELARIPGLLLGVLALAALGLRAKKAFRPLGVAALLVGAVTFGTMAWAGHLGGLIRHPELTAATAATGTATPTDGAAPAMERHEDGDDD